MKYLIISLMLMLSFNAQSQDCESELLVCTNSNNELVEENQEYKDLLVETVTDEEIEDYCDTVLDRSIQLKEERDEAILLKNAAELAYIQLQMNVASKLDSFLNLVATGRVKFNEISIKEGIKPYNNE